MDTLFMVLAVLICLAIGYYGFGLACFLFGKLFRVLFKKKKPDTCDDAAAGALRT